jgi:hypothetical protein
MRGWRSYKYPGASNEGGGDVGATRDTEVPDSRQALARVAEELARARRYERPLTVAVIALGDDAAAQLPAELMRRRPSALAVATRQAMREIDIVCDATPGRCVVVIPEAGPDEARQAVHRTCQACAVRLDSTLRVGIATFPKDGWTFPDLVEVAERQALPLAPEREASAGGAAPTA